MQGMEKRLAPVNDWRQIRLYDLFNYSFVNNSKSLGKRYVKTLYLSSNS